jgi:hypothetical protein
METFHDRRTDRLFLTEPAHPVAAIVILSFAVMFSALGVALPWLETERGWRWLFAAVCIVLVVVLLRLSVRAFTEMVATFDGRSRTLTVTRTQPWRRTEQAFRFEDVVAVGCRESTALDAVDYVIWFRTDYSLEITLAGDRRMRLRANGKAECDDAVRQVRHLMHG